MGNIVGGITNALFGKGGAGTAGDAVRLGKTLGADAKFKGYTVQLVQEQQGMTEQVI